MDPNFGATQGWTQEQYNRLQLEHEIDYNYPTQQQQQNQRQPQLLQQQQQQQYRNQNAFQFPPLPNQMPSDTSYTNTTSSLQGALPFTPAHQGSHSRSSSFGTNQATPQQTPGYNQVAYPSQSSAAVGTNANVLNYRPTAPSYNFPAESSPSIPANTTTNTSNGYLTASPAPMFQPFPSSSSSQQYISTATDEHRNKRARPQESTFSEETFLEDVDFEEGSSEPKDAKQNKGGARACARCKGLKVKCEAKTDTDPCKRCLNGGWQCVTPDRKIRRVPPKREHLLSQIQQQAKQIESLMKQLEQANAEAKRTPPKPERINTSSSGSLSSPVLSPSSTSGSYFGSEAPSIADDQSARNNANIEAWLAKARESFQEFGSFLGIGGAGVSKSFVVDDDEGSSSGDEYVDVYEDFDELRLNNDDRIEIEVQRPDGGQHHSQVNPLTRKTSDSSIGTNGTANASDAPRRRRLHEEKRIDLPNRHAPFGVFEDLMNKSRSREPSVEPEEEDKASGIANEDFFKPNAPIPLAERVKHIQHQLPHILARGIITTEIAEQLFDIYFDRMNLSLSLLDPVLYTASKTLVRSPFLFTVICAIASRFYLERPDLYPQLMYYAQLAAGTALISGTKNVEMCQAYILLSLYPVPVKKWDDQRGWLYLGLAIRTATDINLHLPTTARPKNEAHAREMLNRTRVWLNCLNLDRSTGSQYGKPPIISPKDFIANHSENWWQSSPFSLNHFDIHICAYNAELGVMAAFVGKVYSDPDNPTGMNKSADLESIASAADDELKLLWQRWWSVLERTDMSDSQNSFRTGLLRLAYSYARLVALSYGFQYSFSKNESTHENPFLMRCLAAATDVVNAVVNDICRPSQIHYWRHGPEAQSVFVTFASAFLVKLLQPKFSPYLSLEQRSEIRSIVQKVVDLLGSPEVAIDNKHGPKLYSRFLEKLLTRPMAQLHPVSSPSTSKDVPLPKSKGARRQKSGSEQPQTQLPNIPAFEIPNQVYNHPSPATSGSLSPPRNEQLLSFDSFAPVNGIDPYNPSMDLSEYLLPPLPIDGDLVSGMQSFTDPSGWQDMDMPVGFNWMTQFQQNLGLDLNNPANMNAEDAYMTGPTFSK